MEPSNVNLNENTITPNLNIILMHYKFRKRADDRYMIDIATALKNHGHNVTLYTSDVDLDDCFEEVGQEKGTIKVWYSGWWLPRNQKFLKSIWMALNLILFGPSSKPTIVIMDVNTIALYLLSYLTNYKLIYITHFTALQHLEVHSKSIKITPDLISAKALKQADGILVPSSCLAEVFKRSFPGVKKNITILHPCVDTGLWKDQTMDIARIIPDIPKPNFLFVCFGTYQKRSNFKIVLEAFEHLLAICDVGMKGNIHLVIAGHCSDSNLDQNIYYEELIDHTKNKTFASQVTFLRQLPTVHKKTLIEESIGIILPSKHDLFPDTVLAVLAGSRPIISTNTGFAKEALRHRITGILIEPTPQLFAAAMYKLLTNPAIQIFLSQMGNDVFSKNYTYSVFRRKINGFVEKFIEPPTIINCI